MILNLQYIIYLKQFIKFFGFTYLFDLQVSDGDDKDTTSGYLLSADCSNNCPSSCANWKTYKTASDPWEVDPDFEIKCIGWYL